MSPVVFRPYRGRADVGKLLRAVLVVFQDFRYREALQGERSFALVFEARVGDKQIEGVDLGDLGARRGDAPPARGVGSRGSPVMCRGRPRQLHPRFTASSTPMFEPLSARRRMHVRGVAGQEHLPLAIGRGLPGSWR